MEYLGENAIFRNPRGCLAERAGLVNPEGSWPTRNEGTSRAPVAQNSISSSSSESAATHRCDARRELTQQTDEHRTHCDSVPVAQTTNETSLPSTHRAKTASKATRKASTSQTSNSRKLAQEKAERDLSNARQLISQLLFSLADQVLFSRFASHFHCASFFPKNINF